MWMEILHNRGQLKIVIAGLLSMAMLGFVYTWSIFLQPIELEMSWSRSDVVFNFNLIMMFFPIGIMLAGALNKILPIQRTYLLAACLFPLGFFILSFTKSLWTMYLFCGVLSGIFFGVIYNIILYISNLHFPKNTGAISGLMQAGLGVSALFWGKFAELILQAVGWRLGIRYIALLIWLVIVVSALQIKLPQYDKQAANSSQITADSVENVHWRVMLRDKNFWLFWVTRAIVVAGGVGIFGNAVPIAMENGALASQAVLTLGLMSVTNALGRLFFGVVWDWLGAKRTILLNCFVLGASFVALLCAKYSLVILSMAFVLCGLSYGGGTVLGVSFNKDYYGTKYFQENYGWTTTATIFAGFIGPSVLAYYKTDYGTYNLAYYVFLGAACVGTACIMALKDKRRGENFHV